MPLNKRGKVLPNLGGVEIQRMLTINFSCLWFGEITRAHRAIPANFSQLLPEQPASRIMDNRIRSKISFSIHFETQSTFTYLCQREINPGKVSGPNIANLKNCCRLEPDKLWTIPMHHALVSIGKLLKIKFI
jgi:hypothetical protein